MYHDTHVSGGPCTKPPSTTYCFVCRRLAVISMSNYAPSPLPEFDSTLWCYQGVLRGVKNGNHGNPDAIFLCNFHTRTKAYAYLAPFRRSPPLSLTYTLLATTVDMLQRFAYNKRATGCRANETNHTCNQIASESLAWPIQREMTLRRLAASACGWFHVRFYIAISSEPHSKTPDMQQVQR